jgi:hypothetical protein
MSDKMLRTTLRRAREDRTIGNTVTLYFAEIL